MCFFELNIETLYNWHRHTYNKLKKLLFGMSCMIKNALPKQQIGHFSTLFLNVFGKQITSLVKCSMWIIWFPWHYIDSKTDQTSSSATVQNLKKRRLTLLHPVTKWFHLIKFFNYQKSECRIRFLDQKYLPLPIFMQIRLKVTIFSFRKLIYRNFVPNLHLIGVA